MTTDQTLTVNASDRTPLPSFASAWTVAVPQPTAVTVPSAAVFRTPVSLLTQFTLLFVAFAGETVTVKVSACPCFQSSGVSGSAPLMTMLSTLTLGSSPLTTSMTTVPFFLLPSVAVAVMVAFPFFSALTSPLLLTVATVLSLLAHSKLWAAFFGVAAAFSFAVPPTFSVAGAPVIVTLLTASALTVTVNVFFALGFFFDVAVIFTLPAFFPFTTPLEDTVAIFLLLEVHFTF